jgi:hypothetical protein
MTTGKKALLMAAILAPLATAQMSRSGQVYKVEFNIHDSGDAGAKTGRKYSLVVNEGPKNTFKIGSRVPTATGSSTGNTQFTYIDVGVNIDCVIAERGSQVGMHADMDISGAVASDKTPSGNPIISQIKLQIDTAVTPAKPTVVASFDDPVTSRKFDVETTITKM